MMPADSRFLVAHLKRFIHEAKSNWDMAFKHSLQSLQVLVQSASEPFPLLFAMFVFNVCFLFLLSFFGKLRDWLNKQVTVISSQSARRRRLVDQ